MKKIDLFKSVCKIRVFFDNLNKFRLQKQQKLLCYHANVSEYHQFIDYLEEKQLAFAFKSKLTSVWGQNYFEFLFLMHMYDTVVLIYVIEHVISASEVLENVYHILRLGGLLILHNRLWESYKGFLGSF